MASLFHFPHLPIFPGKNAWHRGGKKPKASRHSTFFEFWLAIAKSPIVKHDQLLTKRRKILDKYGGTSTIDASIMVFGLHEFCVSTCRTN